MPEAMTDSAADLEDLISHTVFSLRQQMPRPIDPDPAGQARYYRMAVKAVWQLGPRDCAQAEEAVGHVACLAHAAHCRAQVNHCLEDVIMAGRLRAQAASMGRDARGYLTSLLRLQAEQDRRAGSGPLEVPEDRAERAVLALLALEKMPADLPMPPKPVMVTQRAAPDPVPRPPPPKVEVLSEAEKQRRRIGRKADEYAVLYPLRSRVLRRMQGMPPDAPFEAPEPALLEAILHGQWDNQLWADRMTPEEAMIDGGHDRMGWPYEPDANPEVVRKALLRANVDWQPGLPWGALSAASVGR